MEISKRYNSVPVKDRYCALFAPTPIFSGPGYPTVSLEFLPCRTLLPWQRIFGTKIDYNSAPWKIIARCFHPHPYFRTRAIRWCLLNFLPADPCCHGNEFWDKIDYNSVPVKDNFALFAPTPLYAAARLYSVAMGQIPRSTERISSWKLFFMLWVWRLESFQRSAGVLPIQFSKWSRRTVARSHKL